MAFSKNDRVKAKQKISFRDGFEVPRDGLGTVVGGGDVWARVKFDADTSSRAFRLVDPGKLRLVA